MHNKNIRYCSETSSINSCEYLNTNIDKCKKYNERLTYDFDFHAYKKCDKCYNNEIINTKDYTTVIELRDKLNQMIDDGFGDNIFCYCDIKDNKSLIPLKYWGIRPIQNKNNPDYDYQVLSGINGSLFAITQDGWETASVGIPDIGIDSLETKEKCDYQNNNAFQDDSKYHIGSIVEWETIGGDKYSGVIIEIDSNVLYVKCTDGIVRPVES